jgi:hypothetical protein
VQSPILESIEDGAVRTVYRRAGDLIEGAASWPARCRAAIGILTGNEYEFFSDKKAEALYDATIAV